jgi:hypothetical protein
MNFFARWFHRTAPLRAAQAVSRAPVTKQWRGRLEVESLEDRTLLSAGFRTLGILDFGSHLGGGHSHSSSASGAATHLEVIVPENVTSGNTFNVLVEAEDASNHTATGYTGTVHFSLGTADTSATLPADYTFTASDHGRHVFQVTLSATGSQTITATDTASSSITGQGTTTVNAAGVVTHFGVYTVGKALAGFPTQVEVVALDASNNVVTGYTGTVHFTSSDSGATLPDDYTFTASDNGSHLFPVTLATAGKQTVTATDTSTSSLTGSGTDKVLSQLTTPTVDATGTVTHFAVYVLGSGLAGSPTPVEVVALDAANHAVANYTGTVHFTSSDGSATLPADYTFTASDNGSHVFSVIFSTTGKQTVTATDTSTSSITGSAVDRIFAQLQRRHYGYQDGNSGYGGSCG